MIKASYQKGKRKYNRHIKQLKIHRNICLQTDDKGYLTSSNQKKSKELFALRKKNFCVTMRKKDKVSLTNLLKFGMNVNPIHNLNPKLSKTNYKDFRTTFSNSHFSNIFQTQLQESQIEREFSKKLNIKISVPKNEKERVLMHKANMLQIDLLKLNYF